MSAAAIPYGGRAVINAVAAGRSPWHGWDCGHAARTPEGAVAYAERARAITGMRQAGLLTEDGTLTEAGQALADRMAEAARG